MSERNRPYLARFCLKAGSTVAQDRRIGRGDVDVPLGVDQGLGHAIDDLLGLGAGVVDRGGLLRVEGATDRLVRGDPSGDGVSSRAEILIGDDGLVEGVAQDVGADAARGVTEETRDALGEGGALVGFDPDLFGLCFGEVGHWFNPLYGGPVDPIERAVRTKCPPVNSVIALGGK